MNRFRYLPLAACLVLAACQTYRPEPLDMAAHEAEWLARQPMAVNGPVTEAVMHTSRGESSLAITIDDAARTALLYNPGLRRKRAEIGIQAAAAAEAGRLSDPTLELGISRLLEGGSSPWSLGLGIGFSIPLSDRLGAEKELAFGHVEQAMAEAAEAELELLLELNLKWASHTHTVGLVTVLSKLADDCRTALQDARRAAEAGRMDAVTVGALELGLAALNKEIRELSRGSDATLAEIRALMGLHPSQTIELSGTIPAQSENASSSPGPSHPALLATQAAHDAAEAAVRLAIERQYPDLSLTPGLEWDEGEPKAGAGLSIPIPVIDGNRREIAETRAARTAAAVTHQATVEALTHRLTTARLAKAAAEESQTLLRAMLSAIDGQLRRLQDLQKEGRGDPVMLIDTLRQQRDATVELHAAILKGTEASIQIEALTDPMSRWPEPAATMLPATPAEEETHE